MLGEDYTQEALEKYNVAQHIGESYPPCYIVCGKDDTTVSCKNSELLNSVWMRWGFRLCWKKANMRSTALAMAQVPMWRAGRAGCGFPGKVCLNHSWGKLVPDKGLSVRKN